MKDSLPRKIVLALFRSPSIDADTDQERGNCRIADKQAKTLLTHCIYLEDSSVTVEGYKVHGSPWQPTYGAGGGAFQIPRDGEEARAVAGGIPADTDVLVTHGPPHGYQVLQYEPVCFSATQ